MWIKTVGKAILSDEMLGWLDYYRFPQLASSWGGPLNGQAARQTMVVELLRTLPIDIVVETGTYRGTTTEFLSSNANVPVLTVEVDGRYCGYARARLLRRRHTAVTRSDSRTFLLSLVRSGRLSNKNPFFYLDAHWGNAPPLLDELDIIFTNWPRSVVVIDDFQVPGDQQYEYDDYGEGKALTPTYIAPLIERFELVSFFPSTRGADETGRRRGCIVLVKHFDTIRLIDALSCLRRINFV
jgi:predicted O-methyltransferase YrrM